MRRADLVALPYRNIEQSGVLYTALAFGRPLVLSDVGGFPEVAELGRGRARCRPATPRRSRRPCDELLADPAERERLAARAPWPPPRATTRGTRSAAGRSRSTSGFLPDSR